MTLKLTVLTIEGWIKSCVDEPQLELCEEIIEKFIVERFKDDISENDMQFIKDGLKSRIYDQMKIVCNKAGQIVL